MLTIDSEISGRSSVTVFYRHPLMRPGLSHGSSIGPGMEFPALRLRWNSRHLGRGCRNLASAGGNCWIQVRYSKSESLATLNQLKLSNNVMVVPARVPAAV
jgi:hypothetical protein